jgi:putative ABC transport system permease protein
MLRASLRSFFAHKGRMILSTLAITLSVAFVAGALIFTDTFNKTFDRLFASTTADVTVSAAKSEQEDEGARSGRTEVLPASLRERIAAVDGVRTVDADVNVTTATVLKDRTKLNPDGPPTIVANWARTELTPVDITSGVAPTGENQIMLDADTARKKNVALGDSLRVITLGGELRPTVSGIVTFRTTNPGAALFFVDLPTAQNKILGKPDSLTGVSVAARQGVSNTDLKNRISAAIGSGYDVKTKEETQKSQSEKIGAVLTVMGTALLAFAGIALLVGGFLIFNTFAMLVAQRTRELGLLRAIGANRGQVNRSVLTEAVLLGVVGSTLGIGLGVGLAYALIALMNAQGMNLSIGDVSLPPTAVIAGYTVGVMVTLLAAMLPSLRASRISPMAALAEVGAPPRKSLLVRGTVGGVLGLASAGLLVAAARGVGSTTDSASLFGFGVVVSLAAVIMLGPVIARGVVPVLGAPLQGMFGTVGKLSRQNALRNPRRTSATAAALMIGLALVSGVAVVASSMESSVNAEIDKQVGADYNIISGTQGPATPFPKEVVEKVRGVVGVGTVTRERVIPGQVSSPGNATSWKTTVLAVDPSIEDAIHVEFSKGSGRQALEAGQLVITDSKAADLKVSVGDKVTVQFGPNLRTELTVGALQKGESQSIGGDTAIISIPTLERTVPDTADIAMFVNAKPGADKAKVKENLAKALEVYPQLTLMDQADIKTSFAGTVNQLLSTVYGLLALAIVIAVLGVVNTLALSVIERTREIGLMRAIGANRGQLRRMIYLESLMIAILGAVLGLLVGLGWGIVGQRLLAEQGLRVLTIPWSTIVTVVIGAAVVGLLAAVFPAARASKMNVLRAIATE